MSEASAVCVLKRATELDSQNRLSEALVCYQEGIQLLILCIKNETNESKKAAFKTKAEEYIQRAEKLKIYTGQQKENSKKNVQVTIDNDSTGWSYERIFAPCLDEFVTRVDLQDPYIRIHHQIVNYLRFCELLVVKCQRLRRIHLKTGKCDTSQEHHQQRLKLAEIADSLKTSDAGIEMTFEFDEVIHDREIRFDNGWIVKIGRGLDIFKAADGKLALGQFRMELRKTHSTTVDVFHRDFTRMK